MIDFTRLEDVKRRRPLIHCVSNIVSANDCANLALAVGASPMMAQAPEEMVDITAISAATVLNTGTPDEEKFRACLLCGQAAAPLAQPVVLDPVGVGASPWRLERTEALLAAFRPTILRVNLGEAKALTQCAGEEQGVDSPAPASLEDRLDTPPSCCPARKMSSPTAAKPGASPAAAARWRRSRGQAVCCPSCAAFSPPWNRMPPGLPSWPPPSGRSAPGVRS